MTSSSRVGHQEAEGDSCVAVHAQSDRRFAIKGRGAACGAALPTYNGEHHAVLWGEGRLGVASRALQ